MPIVDSVYERGQFFVPLALNGSGPQYFIFDTGAGVSAGAGADPNVGAGVSAGAGANPNVGAGVSAGAGANPNVSAGVSAGAGTPKGARSGVFGHRRELEATLQYAAIAGPT